jgi:hypothetical protein
MPKKAVSVTLAEENLLWLRGQARSAGARSLSEVLDRVISRARTTGAGHEAAVRSVKGTIRISSTDPGLLQADAAIRALFPRSRQRRSKTVDHRPKRAGG